MLELNKINCSYGKIQALHEVSIQIKKGEIISLIGANGAGKSTILMAISGIAPIGSGIITFQGKQIDGLPPEKIVSLGISQVPEGRHIFPSLTVLENLHLGAYLRRDKIDVATDLEYIFSLFPILESRKHQPGGNLSGGEQQMLAISRALMAKPTLLLLDEPSMGLAPLNTKQIFKIIKRINKTHNTTIFLVEQNANLALKIADRAYVLENGHVTMHNKAQTLMNDDAIRAAYLGI
ncbi:MAG: ABC transporter ATP-binding protein [Desulfobulbaceae bacterium]|nr:ABC transporter ATP-binding protein [Desulfobulbaceae bacterium]